MKLEESERLSQETFDSVLKEYEKSITLPKQKPAQQFFLCPVGLIGSGKTTVLKSLSEKLSLVRVSGDEIRKLLHNRGLGYDQVWEIGSILVKKFAHQGHSIANDTDGATSRTREALEELAQELQAKIIYIHINPPEEFILNKLRTFKHTWLYRNAEQAIENYNQRKPLHKNLSLPYVFTFDTSVENLGSQIEEATRLIKLESGNN